MFRRGRRKGGYIVPEEDPDDPPSIVSNPTISGNLAAAATLSTDGGIWTGNPETLEYQWKRDGIAIEGADQPFYNVIEDDIGFQITVTVTAFNAHGSASATSAATATIAGVAPVNTVAPSRLGGSSPPVVGETIFALPGTWTGIPVPVFTYQWQQDGGNISGADEVNFTLTTAQIGKAIRCRVTGTNSAGSASANTSASANVVAASAQAVALSNLVVNMVTDATASISVDSTRMSGTVWWVIVPAAAIAPNAAQIQAGTDGSGNPATWGGSLALASIRTIDAQGGPSGLGAADYKAYAVQVSAEDDVSAVVNYSFSGGTPNPNAPGLSDQSAVAVSDAQIDTSITTDGNTGTIYLVAYPAGLSQPSAQQIIDGKQSSGAGASALGSISVSTAGTKTKTLNGLTGATSYDVAWVHRNLAGLTSGVAVSDSPVTTETLVISRATAGTATGLSASTGTGTFTTAEEDSGGGNNAIGWPDNGDAAVGSVSMQTSSFSYYGGMNHIRFKIKNTVKVAAAMWVRARPGNITSNPGTYFDITNGAIGNEGWTGTPTITALGDDWYQIDGYIDMTGFSDLSGVFIIQMASANNGSTVTRSGNINLLYDLRITRPS